MPYTAGSYTLPSGNPVVTLTSISSTWANTTLSDIATALSTCVLKDGTQTITANIPMSSNRITGLGAGTATTDACRVDQAQNSSLVALTSVSGSDTIAGTATPTPSAYALGQVFWWVQSTTNTTAATLNVSGLGAKNLYKNSPAGLIAVVAGDLVAANTYFARYDTAGSTQFVLLNPSIRQTVGAALTATGSSQSDAYALVHAASEFTTVAAGTGAVLPSTQGAGATLMVYNGGANPLKIYPDVGATINGLATNASMTLPKNTTVSFTRVSSTRWVGLLSA